MNLVYYSAKGETYYTMAILSATSLRRVGYADDIIIMTDCDHRHGPWTTLKIQDLNGWFGRAQIHKYIDISKWDKLLYLDCDTIARKNVSPLFDFDGPFAATVEKETIKNANFQNTLYMTKEELIKFGDLNSINSGTFCVKSSAAKEYFDKWAEIYFSRTDKRDDQAALSVMLKRGMPHVYFNKRYIYGFGVMPGKHNKNTILTHFICFTDKYETMIDYINTHI